MNKRNITGQKFNKLTVIKRATPKEGLNRYRARWLCRCECGNLVAIITDKLKNGRTKSCGCSSHMGGNHKTHGRSRTTEYRIWSGMIQRTTNHKATSYEGYGGRGITVCDRWLKFENFYEDMGSRPDNLTLERIDNEKSYSPENCKWDTSKNQARNRRNNRHITIDGVTKVLAVWLEELSMARNTFKNRIARGLTDKESLGL